jgi:NAD(P)H-hydrate epimerase
MLVTTDQMRAIEETAFARGVSAGALMDQAGLAIADVVTQFFPKPAHATAFCGKGNNTGDVLVAARHLIDRGWTVHLDESHDPSELADLPAKHRQALQSKLETRKPLIPTIALDGLLGIGVKGAPREPIAPAIERLDRLRRTHHTCVFAADLPSGLDADTGEPSTPCVTADVTVTIGHCKIGLVADAATNHVGRLSLAKLPELSTVDQSPVTNPAAILAPQNLHPLLPTHAFDSHKGKWGRVGIIAGARGTLGAARLCSEAAVRGGGGLVTLYVKPDAFELFATSCIPEVMVKSVADYREVLDYPLDALGIGPGLGDQHDEEILEILRQIEKPTVADADALNALARNSSQLSTLNSQHLLTPHPGEFARLAPELAHLPRAEAAQRFADERGVTLLFKGARTIIAERDRALLYNTTGNPGMGTGGMGDVLTGVIAAFLGQGCLPRDGASLGAWLCGRAAERYVFGPMGSPETLIASEVIRHLGPALHDLRSGSCY